MEAYGQGARRAVETVGLGVLVGATMEFLVPDFNEAEDDRHLVLDFVGQLVLNGVAIVMVSNLLSRDDPTGGGLFFPALVQAQPSLRERLRWFAGMTHDHMDKFRRQKTIETVDAAEY